MPEADQQPTSQPQPSGRPTLDEDLLQWLGEEPPEVRAADAERIREIAGEFSMGFSARPAPLPTTPPTRSPANSARVSASADTP
jgi:hypothetical protein